MTTSGDVDFLDLDLSQIELHEEGRYLSFYRPDHPLAYKNGMVPLHRHVMSVHLGRWLTSEEMIVFLNGDQHDVEVTNLKVTDRAGLWRHIFGERERAELTCAVCGGSFLVVPSDVDYRVTCSVKCAGKRQRKFDPPREELEEMVWLMPTTKVADYYGVSDKAIEKRCKKLGIEKPGRGYWAKLYAGQRDPDLDQEPRPPNRQS